MSSPRLPVFGSARQAKKRSRRCKSCGKPVGRAAKLYCSSACFIADKESRRKLQEEFMRVPREHYPSSYSNITRKPSRHYFDENC